MRKKSMKIVTILSIVILCVFFIIIIKKDQNVVEISKSIGTKLMKSNNSDKNDGNFSINNDEEIKEVLIQKNEEDYPVMSTNEDENEGKKETWISIDISYSKEDSVNATLYNNRELIITGKGKMKDFENSIYSDFNEKNSNVDSKTIIKVTVENGITNISKNFLNYCYDVEEINLADSIEYIGTNGIVGKFKKIKLPNSLKNIDSNAFNCKYLEEIAIPEGVSNIDGFFACSSLKKVELPNTTKKICENAFFDCPIEEIIFPEGLEEIEFSAFSNAKFTEINLPKSIKELGKHKVENSEIYGAIFNDCDELKKINVDSQNEYFCSVDGVLYNKDKTELILYPKAKDDITEYTIPDTVNTLRFGAFEKNLYLKKIVIPNNISYIYTFDGSNISEMVILEGENNYQYLASLKNCKNLSKIDLGTIKIIGSACFYGCKSLTEIIVPNTVDEIKGASYNAGFLSGCDGLTKIVIPKQTTNISEYAFKDFPQNATLYCNSNSEAHKQAIAYDITYIIDDDAPVVEINGIPTEKTKENVVLTINAKDDKVGLAEKAYSFDGGETWQKENTKVYSKNESNIQLQVKDALGNIETKTIDITQIEKSLESDLYDIDIEKREINNIEPSTTLNKFLENISLDRDKIKMINAKEEEITSNESKLATGMKMIVDDVTFTIIVKGDTNGDGESDLKDILMVNKHRLNKIKLNNEFFTASDVNKDGKVDLRDLLQINKYRLGKIEKL